MVLEKRQRCRYGCTFDDGKHECIRQSPQLEADWIIKKKINVLQVFPVAQAIIGRPGKPTQSLAFRNNTPNYLQNYTDKEITAATVELKMQHLHSWHFCSQKLTHAVTTVSATEKDRVFLFISLLQLQPPQLKSDEEVSAGEGCALAQGMLGKHVSHVIRCYTGSFSFTSYRDS